METIPTHGGKRPSAGRKKGPVSSAAQRYAEARADKERHLARLRKLDADVAEGRLIPTDMLRDVMANAAAQIGAIMDAIPVKLKREAPHLTATDIEIVKREIAAAMNAASRVRYNP